MKNIIALCIISFALGMTVMLFIENKFIAVIFIGLLFLAGYCLLSSNKC